MTFNNTSGSKIIILAKQVPETRKIGKDTMTTDGAVKREALPVPMSVIHQDTNAKGIPMGECTKRLLFRGCITIKSVKNYIELTLK